MLVIKFLFDEFLFIIILFKLLLEFTLFLVRSAISIRYPSASKIYCMLFFVFILYLFSSTVNSFPLPSSAINFPVSSSI